MDWGSLQRCDVFNFLFLFEGGDDFLTGKSLLLRATAEEYFPVRLKT